MKQAIRVICFSVYVFALLSAHAFAQNIPDAGILLQEQRQTVPKLPDRLPAEEKKEVLRPALIDAGVRVLVKGFRFTGSFEGIVTEAELQALVKDKIGKELGFTELQQTVAHVTNYLREKKGFLLARAYLPRQDITEGTIEIAILAGRIDGKVKINLKQSVRIRPSVLEGIADQSIPKDSPARMERIERAVLIMNDLPGVNAQASLEPGDSPGSTRVVIDAAEGRLIHGVLSGDNYGDRYTGAYRGTGQVSINDITGFADSLSLYFTGAENLLQGRGAYAIPLGSSGLIGSIYYSYLSYKLGKELTDLKAKGWAESAGVTLSYPCLRSRRASIWSGAGFEYLMLDDEANNAKTRDRKVAAGNFNLTGSFYDDFGGGGLTNANIIVTGGNVDLSGLQTNRLADDLGPETAGGFWKGSYSLGRLQRVTRQFALFGSLRGQYASRNLDSSQKFILGGPTGIRAYPIGEAAADEGHALTIETRYDVPSLPSWASTQVIGFFDTGWVKLHSSAWPGAITSASGRNEYFLSGAGVGLNVGKAGLYSARVSYAFKIGPNEGKSMTGKDSDGLSDDGRFWLQLVIWI